MQITNRQHIDYFKVFKLLDLKKLQKQGEVKLVQDKTFGRKILSVEGNVSTQNYIIFDSNDVTKSQPNLSFAQRYLYIIGWMDVGKNFCFQIELYLNSKAYRILFSTVYKQSKLTTQGSLQVPLLELKSAKWTILVIDLYEVCQKFSDQEQMRLSFKLSKVEVRANSRVKNMYLSDNLYDPYTLPKDMELPLKKGQDYYSKFDYLIINEKERPQLKNRQGSLKNIDSSSVTQKKTAVVKQRQKQYERQKEEKQESSFAFQKSIKIPKESKIKKIKVQKEESMQNKFQEFYEDENSMPIKNIEPKPQITINCKLVGIEGRSLIHEGVISLQAFIIYPTIFAVHKPVQCMSLHQQFAHILAVGYIDGSICIWDIVRHKSLSYIKTELSQIKCIHIRGSGEEQKIFMVGNDKIKRETILIINRSDVLFRQISNYSIKNFMVCNVSQNENQEIIVSYGFENIRLWKLNSSNNIITGVGLYLGKMNRKVTYSHACKLTEDIILVIDNHGYLTRISTYLQRVEEVKKISQNGLDFIINIKQLNAILICESGGNIKLLSYELQVLEQFQFGNRVKELSYAYNNNNGQVVLKIDHYNNCTAHYNIQLSRYDYKSRQHTQPVVCLGYNRQLCKVVTVSLDNTIRIWSMFSSEPGNEIGKNPTKAKSELKQHQMECMMKEEYQFLISNGEQILALALDSAVYAFVGFKGGIVRKIDLLKYEIIEQRTFIFKSDSHADQLLRTQFYIKNMQVSKNNKNLLICVSQTHKNKLINNYVILSDCNLNIVYKYNAPLNYDYGHENSKVLAGFSDTHKKIYICWTYGSIKKLQIFSLTDTLDKICVQFYIECDPLEIRLADNRVFVTGTTKNNKSAGNIRTYCVVYEVYCEDSGELMRAINTDINSNFVEERKQTEINSRKQRNQHRISFPLMVHSNCKQQLELQTLQASPMMMSAKECIDMPEPVENITICESKSNGMDMSGLIICSGCNSYALYAVTYEIKNAGQLHENINSRVDEDSNQNYSKFKQYNKRVNMISKNDKRFRREDKQQSQQQLECVQNKLIQFDDKSFNSLQSRQVWKHSSNKSNTHPSVMSQKLDSSCQIRSNARQQISEKDNFVDQTRSKPTLLNTLPQKQEQNYDQCKEQDYLFKKPSSELQCESQNTNQNTINIKQTNHQGIQIMYGWHNRYTYNEKTINQCRRLIWNSALQAALFISHRNLILHYFKQPIHQKIIRLPLYPNFILPIGTHKKCIAIAFGNQIRLFSQELVFLRTFSTFGSEVISLCISNCEGYIVVLSSDSKKNKSYIQVLDILTCNTLCSTYLRMVNQGTRIVTNPFTHPLQFLLFNTAQAHFYRLTSILSLQTQELEDLPKIINNKGMGQILCGNYIKLQEQELILFGTSDGSIVIVDGRANSIMMVCRNITKYGIVDIMVQQYEIDNQVQECSGVLILMTQSNIIHKYNLKEVKLQNIIQVFNKAVNETNSQQINLLTTDSQITLFSKVQKLSSESYGMLIITKLGVLWLVDVLDSQTIKILTVHSNVSSPSIHPSDSKIISKCIVSSELTKSMSCSDIKIITGSFDGTVKETSFFNLEQTIEVYKPRRIVNDFEMANGMIIVAFGMEIFFYLIEQHHSQNQWKFIGSINIAQTQRSISSDKSSINLLSENVKIKNIAFSDNYIVLTSNRIFLIYHEKNLSIQTGKLKLEVKKICNSLEDAIDLEVLGYNQILVREKSKVNVWLRKDKRGELPLKQLTKVDQVAYYISDVYHIEASYANFICNSFAASIKKDKLTQKQLIISLKSHPIIQIRDIQQHSIIRQIQIGVSSIVRVLKITIDGNYMIGDQQGVVWLIKQNGLTLNKVKVFDGEVTGLIEIENCGKCGSNAIAYGDNVAFIHI